MGRAVCLYCKYTVYIGVFFYSSAVYWDCTGNLHCCSQVSDCERVSSVKVWGIKNIYIYIYETLLNRHTRPPGGSLLSSKGKRLHLWSWRGSWEERGQRSTEGKFNKEWKREKKYGVGEEDMWLIVSCLGLSWLTLFFRSSSYTASLLSGRQCLKVWCVKSYVDVAAYKMKQTRVTTFVAVAVSRAHKLFDFKTFTTRQFIITNVCNNLKQS